jgi:hypothetical protein
MRHLLMLLSFLALPALAQQAQQTPRPLPEEQAFARLAPEIQAMLQHLSPADALYKVQFARQNLLALGHPNPTLEQLRSTLQAVLSPGYASVESASAGATTFPRLNPLVAPAPPPLAR